MLKKLWYSVLFCVGFFYNYIQSMNSDNVRFEQIVRLLNLSPEELNPLPLEELEKIPLGFAFVYYRQTGRDHRHVSRDISSLINKKRKAKQFEFLKGLPKDTLHFDKPYAELGNRTPLDWASQFEDKDYVELCLKLGVDVNFSYENGETALTAAMCVGNAQITDLLLGAGAQITKQDIELADWSKKNRNKRKNHKI